MSEQQGKALISGGTGFLGRNLAVRLRAMGREVVVLTRREISDPVPGVGYVRLDLSRRDDVEKEHPELEGTRAFFHLASDVDWATELSPAGLASLRRQVEHPILLLEKLGRSLERVVFSSSMMVYPLVSPRPLREDRDEQPPNFYGAHKLVLEQAGGLWSRRTGRPFVSARIGQVYGPGMRVNRFLLDAVATARRGEPITVFGDGSPQADWLHADDVVDALLACERTGTGVVNVGSGSGTSNRALAEAVVAALGSASRVELLPERPVAPRNQVLDVTRARTWLGWSPRIPLFEGIRTMGTDHA